MSAKDQFNDEHGGHHHKWRARMKDWFLLPCSHVPKRPEGITRDELSRNNGQLTITDPSTGVRAKSKCWIAVDGFVYDVTQFIPYHPGGELIFQDVLGRDCTAEFHHNHISFNIKDATPELLVGPLVEEVVSQTASADGSGGAAFLEGGGGNAVRVSNSNIKKKNSTAKGSPSSTGVSDDGDDDDDDSQQQERRAQEELSEEDVVALKDLFDSLVSQNNIVDDNKSSVSSTPSVLTELQFHNFLAATGVTDQEKDLTLKRLQELRPNAKECGIDLVTFVSLF